MLVRTVGQVQNRLLEGLPRAERKRVLTSCKQIGLEVGEVLCQADRPMQYCYFPGTGIISLVTTLTNHPPLEMSLIGNEGMLGVTLVLGVHTAPLHAIVQSPGTALQISVAKLLRELRDSPALLKSLSRYLYVRMVQLSQSVACSHYHETEPRLARWLLMTHDRSHADHFHLTHQRLADMLGVQRSAVTIAAGVLQKRKLIQYTRGEISILNRSGLEATSCECYAAIIADYNQQFSTSPA